MSEVQIPKFDDEIQQYVESQLSAGKHHQRVAAKVLLRFPEFFSHTDLPKDILLKKLTRRIYDTKSDPRRPSALRIRNNREEMVSQLETIDMTDPMKRLETIELTYEAISMLIFEEKIDKERSDTLVKILNAQVKASEHADKIVNALVPPIDPSNSDSTTQGQTGTSGITFMEKKDEVEAEADDAQPGSPEDVKRFS